MADISFKKFFFEPISDMNEESFDFSKIYNGIAPIYFTHNSQEPDTSIQLEAFKASTSYTQFKTQYQALLKQLNTWCIDHKVQVEIGKI